MSSGIKVNFEIGHVASVRSKPTPEGFTHDWEVFLRGTEGAQITHFVEKVVFHLHASFNKPKRVVKAPPFCVKESGYAGFTFPIEIYLKNKSEPKKIQFYYDFTLQEYGILRDRYVFQHPNEDFRKKLLNGGGIPVHEAYYTNPGQEIRSKNTLKAEKQQRFSKPMSKPYKDEMKSFENVFGPLCTIKNKEQERFSKEKGQEKSNKRKRHNERSLSSNILKKQRVASPVKSNIEECKSLKYAFENIVNQMKPIAEEKLSNSKIGTEMKDRKKGIHREPSEKNEVLPPEPRQSYCDDLSSDHIMQLSDLQQRILKIIEDKDFNLIGDIMDVIYRTGCFEEKFENGIEFDLCLLDSCTIQRLIQLVVDAKNCHTSEDITIR